MGWNMDLIYNVMQVWAWEFIEKLDPPNLGTWGTEIRVQKWLWLQGYSNKMASGIFLGITEILSFGDANLIDIIFLIIFPPRYINLLGMGNTESADYSYDDEIRQRPPPYAGSSEYDQTWQQPPYTGSSEVHNYQNMWRQSTYIPDNFSSLDEVISALRDAGLQSSNLILGIDFTKSNEWTGKYSFNRRSLHTIGSIPNPYEQAISVIGRTLSPFDEDNLIPCFGFGDASTHDKYVFSFFTDHRPCHGFEEALARYREIVPSLKLSGL
ncbi:E3 ubiquitin-protein ligase RGLG2-like [Macadamia integrifolia]|uniref:E3 ubiquitin-protein ligase RGLG2-like n=1 Tax=Macadamia integrifolia TaxID=60698 RepID=UPI001C4EB94D|nr:E3 ubiquitin-protein ligase RGLG2-like [Macadamia integrifolia]